MNTTRRIDLARRITRMRHHIRIDAPDVFETDDDGVTS